MSGGRDSFGRTEETRKAKVPAAFLKDGEHATRERERRT